MNRGTLAQFPDNNLDILPALSGAKPSSKDGVLDLGVFDDPETPTIPVGLV